MPVYEAKSYYNEKLIKEFINTIHKKKLIRINWGAYAIAMIIAIAISYSSDKRLSLADIYVIVFGGVIFGVYSKFRGKNSVVNNMMKANKNSMIQGEVRYKFYEDKFIFESDRYKLHLKYDVISGMVEDLNNIYLRINENTNEFCIIEKKSIDNIDEFKIFIEGKINERGVKL